MSFDGEHDCCDICGRGSCPGSGSGGDDACVSRAAVSRGTNMERCRCNHDAVGRLDHRWDCTAGGVFDAFGRPVEPPSARGPYTLSEEDA